MLAAPCRRRTRPRRGRACPGRGTRPGAPRRRAEPDDVARRLLEDADELAADDLALLLGVGRPRRAPRGTARARRRRRGRPRSRRRSPSRPARPPRRAAARGRRTRRSAGRRPPAAPGRPPRRSRRRRTARRAPGASPTCSRIAATSVLDDVGRRSSRPSRPAPRQQEVLEHPLAERRVHDLGVPLHAVQPALVVLERGDRRAGGGGGHPHTGRAPRSRSRRGDIHTDCVGGLAVEQGRGGVGDARRGWRRTRAARCGRPCRRAPGPSPGSRSRCRSTGTPASSSAASSAGAPSS